MRSLPRLPCGKPPSLHPHPWPLSHPGEGDSAMPTLVIANKLYSSWSLRPWLLMRHLGIAFDEVLVPLDQPDTKAEIAKYSPAGKVPILVEGEVRVWESLAILDHLAETCEEVWPREPVARAMARSA